MQPDFFSRMCALAGRMTVKCPLRWTAITASHSSSVMLKIIRSRRIPAQQSTMCRSPNDLSAASTMALPPAMVATFSALARARPPVFSISLTTASAGALDGRRPPRRRGAQRGAGGGLGGRRGGEGLARAARRLLRRERALDRRGQDHDRDLAGDLPAPRHRARASGAGRERPRAAQHAVAPADRGPLRRRLLRRAGDRARRPRRPRARLGGPDGGCDGGREPGRVAAPLLPSRVEALRGLHRVSHARLAAGRAGGDADALAARRDRLDGDGDRDRSARLGCAVRVVHGAGQPRRHRGGLRRHLRRARLRRRRRARVQLRAARATGGVDRGGARGAAGHALVAGTDARAGYAVRFLKYEFLTAILPRSNVKTSQPLTSIFLPSAVVPVKTHSERPRSPATKWRASPKWASGKILKTFAKASRTRSRPSYRVPQASLPAVVSKTQSSAMKVMMKS